MTCKACGLPGDLHPECAEQAAELGVCVESDEMPTGWLLDMFEGCEPWFLGWYACKSAQTNAKTTIDIANKKTC